MPPKFISFISQELRLHQEDESFIFEHLYAMRYYKNNTWKGSSTYKLFYQEGWDALVLGEIIKNSAKQNNQAVSPGWHF